MTLLALHGPELEGRGFRMITTYKKEEDDVAYWDDVDGESWSSDDDEPWPKFSQYPEECKNETCERITALYNFQTDLQKLPSMNLDRLFNPPSIYYKLGTEVVKLSMLHEKLVRLFGPREIHVPLEVRGLVKEVAIMVRSGNTFSRYIREIERGYGSYIFKREITRDLSSESYLSFNFTQNSQSTGSYLLETPILTEGNLVKTLPCLVEEILNQGYHDTIISTYSETYCARYGRRTGSITIFFERRGLFLEENLRQCFGDVPLGRTEVNIILEYSGIYNVQQWKHKIKSSRQIKGDE